MPGRLRGAGLADAQGAGPVSAPRPTRAAPPGELLISILSVPDCPSLSRVRAELQAALDHLGATAVVEEIEGAFSSPTVLIDGAEIDGYALGSDAACRISLPNPVEIKDAILAASAWHAQSGRAAGIPR